MLSVRSTLCWLLTIGLLFSTPTSNCFSVQLVEPLLPETTEKISVLKLENQKVDPPFPKALANILFPTLWNIVLSPVVPYYNIGPNQRKLDQRILEPKQTKSNLLATMMMASREKRLERDEAVEWTNKTEPNEIAETSKQFSRFEFPISDIEPKFKVESTICRDKVTRKVVFTAPSLKDTVDDLNLI